MSINSVSKTVAGPFLRQFTASIMPRGKVRKNGSNVLHRGKKIISLASFIFALFSAPHTQNTSRAGAIILSVGAIFTNFHK